MKNTEINKDFKEKLLRGLEKSYEKMIAEKRLKNAAIAILKDGKVVLVKP